MTGGGEETATDDTRPKAVAAREKLSGPGKTKIEHLEFVRRARELAHMRPAAGNLMQDDPEAEDGAPDIQEHLNGVRPDHRRHPSFEGVKQRQTHDYKNGNDFAGAQDN